MTKHIVKIIRLKMVNLSEVNHYKERKRFKQQQTKTNKFKLVITEETN